MAGRRQWLCGALLLVGTTYVARLDAVAGLYVDDAWYILLAKAIASGEGFRLINAPAPGILPFYPPGFPALLALAFLVAPDFPQNIWLLKGVSIAAMLGVAVVVVTWGRGRGLAPATAILLALATVLSPAFVFLAGATVMSEPVFTLLQLAALVALERAVRDGRTSMPLVVAAALLGSGAVLVRSMAAGVLAASAVYLLAARRPRAAVVYATIAVVVVGSWTAYARAVAPDADARALVNDAIVHGYGEHFWMRIAGYPESGVVGVGDLPARVWSNLRTLVLNDAGALVAYPAYRTLEPLDAASPAWWTVALSAIVAVPMMIGLVGTLVERVRPAELALLVTAAIALVWPFPPFRFLLPLLPVVLLATARGLAVVTRAPRIAPLVLLAIVAVVNEASVLRAIAALHRDPPPAWSRAWDENVAMLAWADAHLEPDAILASHNPALVHLLTRRRTVGYWDARTNLSRWRRAGARYWVDCWLTAAKYPDPARSGLPILHRHDGDLGLHVVRLAP